MITISQLTELLGWVALLNMGYLLIATLLLVFMRGSVSSIYSKMFDLDEADLSSKYFSFLSNYKVVTLVFVLTPYIALKIMGQ
jgi:hypothetical protein